MYHSPINQWKSQFMKPKTSRSNYLDWTYVTPVEQQNNVVQNYDTREDPYESFHNYIEHVMHAPQGRKHRPKNKKHKKTRGFQPTTVQQNLQPIEQIQPIQQPAPSPVAQQAVPADPNAQAQQAVPLAPVIQQAPDPAPVQQSAQQPVPEPQPEQPAPAPAPAPAPEPQPEQPQQAQPAQTGPTQGMYDNGDYEYDTYTDSEN